MASQNLNNKILAKPRFEIFNVVLKHYDFEICLTIFFSGLEASYNPDLES